MRPVNLLPSSARPYVASGAKSNSSYIVLGVLAALVIAVAAYVLTTNQISSRNDQIQTAKAEQTQAEAKVSALQSYGTFSTVAQTRIATVGTLGVNRVAATPLRPSKSKKKNVLSRRIGPPKVPP